MSDDTITQAELRATFPSGKIPMWAVDILFNSPDDWTVEQVRKAIDERLSKEADMSKHTPGPWFVRAGFNIDGSDEPGPYGARFVRVAKVGNYYDKELLKFNRDRWEADARLIAAAPDMYEALSVVAADSRFISGEPLLRQIRAILARAAINPAKET